ncbi:MAG: UDP-N-acetylmuramate:L-alanyl-gamma-D-glutamyl-meso-diaminopimelate ligase [Burkholderiales bacterium]
MHLHILGICGTFMGGLALIARSAGLRVTGCDAKVYPPMSTQLAEQGIELVEGYGADQLKLQPDIWVVGNAVARGNPLMEAILDAGERFISGPQWLAENILQTKWVMAVAGTHGKTSTSSMLAWILEAAGHQPSFLIGGIPSNFAVSARLTASPYFVIEADEYDTAFFDKRSKFLHYGCRTAVLNNLEFDHADIFPDLAAIETQFHHFVRILPRRTRLVVNGEDEALRRVLDRGSWSEVDAFAVAAGWDIGREDAEAFEVRYKGVRQGDVRWTQLGRHNRLNALAAIAAANHAGVPAPLSVQALTEFTGVQRRMQVRGTINGVTVYDDFAHHPTAIATTLAGLRARVGTQRIFAVLEPRSNTMKRGTIKEALAGSLADADRIFCFSADLEWDAGQVLAPLGQRVVCEASFALFLEAIMREVRSGDHVLVMSNGGFNGIHQKLLDRLAAT